MVLIRTDREIRAGFKCTVCMKCRVPGSETGHTTCPVCHQTYNSRPPAKGHQA